jgi:hypothetical protein
VWRASPPALVMVASQGSRLSLRLLITPLAAAHDAVATGSTRARPLDETDDRSTVPLVAANQVLSLDSSDWSFGFTAAGGGPSAAPPLGTVTVPGTMEAQGFGPPNPSAGCGTRMAR